MIPKLIIEKQREEGMEWMTAKMNLQTNKTVKILIWSCSTPSNSFTAHIRQVLMTLKEHGLGMSVDLELVRGNGGQPENLRGESSLFLSFLPVVYFQLHS